MNSTDKIIEHLIYNPGISRQEIADALRLEIGVAQMKRILAQAIESGDIRTSGKARATRYYATPKAQLLRTIDLDSYYAVDADRRQMLTSYNFDLIRTILPSTEIFTRDEMRFLADREESFRKRVRDYPKELYAKEMERLAIDLSWKSSEIEGNTYTLLETVNLLKDKIEAAGKKREEAIMLLNHKTALKAIIEHSAYFTSLSLSRMEDVHSILIEELGVDRNLRHIRVGISGTNYRPLEIESQIREAVEDMCTLVNGKDDPYEKSLLTLLLIAYIQPFTDGNKRTSRLMANSLLISRALCPLSFRTVEANDYRAALLLFYEQNNITAFKHMFLEQVEFATNEYF